jgi:hypothetical protein
MTASLSKLKIRQIIRDVITLSLSNLNVRFHTLRYAYSQELGLLCCMFICLAKHQLYFSFLYMYINYRIIRLLYLTLHLTALTETYTSFHVLLKHGHKLPAFS